MVRAQTSSQFGDHLRRLRETAGLTQEELAERAGLSAAAVGALERGHRRHPHPHTVRALADALALSAEEAAALRAALSRRPDLQPASTLSVSPPLPVPATRIVGRQRELAELRSLLTGGEARLVTLTGPGGVGKTRLAVEAASHAADAFSDGVWLVDLAPIRDPALVWPTVAQVMGLRDSGDAPISVRLGNLLLNKRVLTLLDNFEQVLAVASDVRALLASCPGLTILLTSREPLRIEGEREIPIAPLAVPDRAHPEAIDELISVEAVQLFSERAQATLPSFRVTAENVGTVGDICRRIDGLPLAIELAAARIKVLPPAAMLARLEQRLPVLSGSRRDVPERQQTMRAAIAWSHDLLVPPERTLLRRLAVFVGGFSLEAAEAVGGAPDDLGINVLDVIASLVDKSLIHALPGSAVEPRYGMLETIREFGLEQLAASAEEDSIRARHAMLFVSLAEQAEDAFFGPGEIAALDRCEAELGNFRAAMDWSAGEGGDPAVGLRLGAALWWLWLRRVGLREGREWLEQGLAQGRPVPTDVQAKALAVAAEIATFQADYERALMRLEESLALYDTIADPFGRARAKFFLGDYYETRGQVDKSDPPLEAALAGFQSLGATGWAGTALHFLATTASLRNEDERSLELAERALHLCREAGFGTGIAMTVGHLGELAIRRGDYAEAERFVREALALRLERDDRYGATIQLTDLARLAAIRDEAENAAWLYGVAAALRLAAGTVVDEAWRDEHDQLIAGLRTSLGNERYEEIWLASHALTPEQAIAEAREVISEQPSSATTSQ